MVGRGNVHVGGGGDTGVWVCQCVLNRVSELGERGRKRTSLCSFSQFHQADFIISPSLFK